MPPETTVTSPPQRNSIAKVAISDGIPSKVMTMPLISPMVAPTETAKIIANQVNSHC